MNFDFTVKLADLISIILFIGGGFAAYFKIKGRLDMHSLRLKNIEDAVKGTIDKVDGMQIVITQMAVQTTRLDHLDQDIRDLREGKGFIHREVSGEYISKGKVTKT